MVCFVACRRWSMSRRWKPSLAKSTVCSWNDSFVLMRCLFLLTFSVLHLVHRKLPCSVHDFPQIFHWFCKVFLLSIPRVPSGRSKIFSRYITFGLLWGNWHCEWKTDQFVMERSSICLVSRGIIGKRWQNLSFKGTREPWVSTVRIKWGAEETSVSQPGTGTGNQTSLWKKWKIRGTIDTVPPEVWILFRSLPNNLVIFKVGLEPVGTVAWRWHTFFLLNVPLLEPFRRSLLTLGSSINGWVDRWIYKYIYVYHIFIYTYISTRGISMGRRRHTNVESSYIYIYMYLDYHIYIYTYIYIYIRVSSQHKSERVSFMLKVVSKWFMDLQKVMWKWFWKCLHFVKRFKSEFGVSSKNGSTVAHPLSYHGVIWKWPLEAVSLHFCNLNHFEITFKITLESLLGWIFQRNVVLQQFRSIFET